MRKYAAIVIVIFILPLISACSQSVVPFGSMEATIQTSDSLSTTKPVITWTPWPSVMPAPEESPTEWPMATLMPEPTRRPKDAPLKESDYYILSIENTPGYEDENDEGPVERKGVVTANGDIVMKPIYSDITLFSKNNGKVAMFFAREYEKSGYTEYDGEGEEYQGAGLFPGSYGKFYSPVGRPMNDRKYTWAWKLRGQWIAARSAATGKAGVMDYAFKPLIPFQYDVIVQTKSYYAAFRTQDGKYFLYFYDIAGKPKGNLEIGSEYYYYDEELADDILLAQGPNGKFGFIDGEMTWINPPSISLKKEDYENEDVSVLYSTLSDFISARTDGHDEKLLPPGYLNIEPFLDGNNNQVKHDGSKLYLADDYSDSNNTYYKTALIDEEGTILFETKTVRRNYLFYPVGIILCDGRVFDFDGKEQLPGINNIVAYLPDEKIYLSKTACYTTDGRKLPFPEASSISYAGMDRFIIVLPDGKQGICNSAGLWIAAPTDHMYYTTDDDSSYSAYANDWQIICGETYNIGQDNEYSTWGLIDPNGKIVLEPVYDDITRDYENSNLYWIRSGQNRGLVDAWGHLIWYSVDFDRLMD